jgi:uncharacterized SAM-binding protein YcdF (DUF218 family)
MSLAALPSLLLIPPLNCLAASCLGALLHRHRAGRILLALGLGGMVVFGLPMVAGILLCSLETGFSTTPPPKDPPGAIVILSGDETNIWVAGHEAQMVGHLTLEREVTGANLARRTGLPILVTGGVVFPGDPSLAALMSRSLKQDFGLLPTWTENRSSNTWENAKFSATILRAAGIRSVYVVTHAWHMRRAMMAFRAAGLIATAAPTPLDDPPHPAWHNLLPHISAWQESFWAMHEWIGCAWYALRA